MEGWQRTTTTDRSNSIIAAECLKSWREKDAVDELKKGSLGVDSRKTTKLLPVKPIELNTYVVGDKALRLRVEQRRQS